ncbi:MAG: hypothetical protein M3501_06530 [Actinomycetota bacterium]|nr:hypothetical protein [Actinomycetota bacterium]MDQ3351602.1 hypothetical protein [Actinomycetota bacterium]
MAIPPGTATLWPVKTRTLLLLSIVTGLAILVAGGIQLIRVSGQQSEIPNRAVGEVVSVADMDVTVEGSSASGDVLTVTITLGGVDDDDATEGFELVAPDVGVLQPVRSDIGDAAPCASTTETSTRCELRFDLAGAGGDTRTLRYQRGDERVRWLLSD